MCTVVSTVYVCSTREHAFINRTNIQSLLYSVTLQRLSFKGPLVEEMHVNLFSKRAASL